MKTGTRTAVPDGSTGQLALAFSERRVLARSHLRLRMEALGLRERDGWKIVESVRAVSGGTELVMRPMHLHLDAPADLECIVKVMGSDGSITLETDLPSAQPR
jgi:hypothetical protein